MLPSSRSKQFVVCSAHNEEDNRKESESHELNGLSADPVDEDEGSPKAECNIISYHA